MTTTFVPMLALAHGVKSLEFYERAFGAIDVRTLRDDDGSIHISEMTIEGALVHFHEESARGTFSPSKHGGVTTTIGIFVDDVDAVMSRALAAGATLLEAAQDHDYGYRQGTVIDPFGHHWLIERAL
jgi:PhnB protein